MPQTPARLDALRRFVAGAIADDNPVIEAASADASFRSYWRVAASGGTVRGLASRSDVAGDSHATCVVMDAPPDKEDLASWLDIDTRLRNAGLHAPHVFAVDVAQGFVLMEDLGVRTYLPELGPSSVDALYGDALDALLRMQAHADITGLPGYDRQRLVAEMALLPEWFLRRHLGFTPDGEAQAVIEAAFSFLAQVALEQPRAFVHRDFHSRNLLVVENAGADDARFAGPGIIDFQDALTGPVTYDLVSLLRDCYVEWDAERIEGWMEAYRLRLRHAHLIGTDVDTTRFRRWFDLTGLQRHIKVLGIFCRLWYRDGKAQYLPDLRLAWRYAITVAQRYPELAAFAALLERALGERDITQPQQGPAP